ncbi:hypothetical protein [Saccharopolyspora spinosa]|uniref:Uncharacterized protein n=1 Tax=Saccharopolyspora spinosa TaxID=60894 RepID=A0A2N3Y765_SACSN|nr:hypothetical protein [Saccharopolyspora spinosa]PKW18782.1 hypothetical protein A8926_6910 [Saccharopolyspora spinosa]
MSSFLVAIAMCYILIKIPFWVLSSVRGGGRSRVGSLIKGFLAYKTFGLIRGGMASMASRQRSRGATSASAADPYENSRAGADGQYVLPLPGLARGRLRRPFHNRTKPAPAARSPRNAVGRQGALFSVDGKPVRSALPPDLGPSAMRLNPRPGEQHMLPIHARHDPDRTTPDTPPSSEAGPPAGAGQLPLFTRSGRPRPQALPPKPGNPGAIPTRIPPGGQYPLPLVGPFTTQSVPTPPPPPTAQPDPGPVRVPGQRPLLTPNGEVHPHARARRPRRVPPKPAAPSAYKGIRPDKHGQYALPLDLPRPARSRPRPTTTGASPAGADPSQPELPLDLPAAPSTPAEGDPT